MGNNEKIKSIIDTSRSLYEYLNDRFNIEIDKNELKNFIVYIKGSRTLLDYPAYSSEAITFNKESGRFYVRSYQNQKLKDIISRIIVDLINEGGYDEKNDFSQITNIFDNIYESAKQAIITYIENASFPGLFDNIIALSNMVYEKNACTGNISFGNDGSIEEKLVSFSDKKEDRIYFTKDNLRVVRKILETTNRDVSLLIRNDDSCVGENKYYLDSLCKIKDSDFRIIFLGKNHFKVDRNNNIVIEYKNGNYFIKDRLEISSTDYKKIQKFFHNSSKAEIFKMFLKNIYELNDSFHGTIVVVTDDIKFINRMNKNHRSINVSNSVNQLNLFKVYSDSLDDKKSALIRLSCVDGAIILRPNGNVESFGVILDGHSRNKGDRSRGSRFNSTKTFIEDYAIENRSKKYLGVVMSEDGPINVFSSKDMKNE